MSDAGGTAPRQVLPAMRATLVLFAALTLLGFTSLFILADGTDRTFAWTMQPALTAAFLGAGYGAGLVLMLLSLRARRWSQVRVTTLTVLVFTVVTLAATLLHSERLRLTSPVLVTRFASWIWLVVYLVVPAGIAVMVVLQERLPGTEPGPRAPLPRWLAALLAVQGATMLAVGASLFAAPGTARVLWPWTLAPIAARMVAAWLLAFGVASALALRLNDLPRLRVSAAGYAAFGALELAALARYVDDVRWGHPSAWIYLGLVISVLVAGAVGWAAASRRRSRPVSGSASRVSTGPATAMTST